MTLYEQKFRDILAEILQLDQAELDFGIYRIMNQKRKDIEAFLNNRLVPEITKILKTQTSAGTDISAMENEVFSHLAKFFSRYYEGGDFISKRRYKDDAYAIPYSGEEVKLYWANADQYYIKTSEYFKNYSFVLPTSRRKVHFVLRDADTEQNNNKAANNMERRFQLCEEDCIAEDDDELNIFFTYELMPKATKQDVLIKDAEAKIISSFAEGRYADFAELANEKVPTEKNKERTLLMKHLQDYTAKNNFDYFIHKDLGGFLRRELDFYIKNEVMFLDDLDATHIMEHLAQVKAIKLVGEKIITFLAQLEDFQKKLWLKKKFVVGCDYCITLDRIPRTLYSEIIANDAQRKEWARLFAIDEIKGDMMTEGYSEPLTEKFLEENPFLVLDTKFFDAEFKHKVVESMENVDEECNGLLINSENFQALELLQEKYRERIRGMYYDPPYNTKSNEFIYKDTFKHSSWISMMGNRLALSSALLNKFGSIMVSCDENENTNLKMLLNSIFQEDNFLTDIIWEGGGKNDQKYFSISHEYIQLFLKNKAFMDSTDIRWLERKEHIDLIYSTFEKIKKQFPNDYAQQEKALKKWYKSLPDGEPAKRQKHFNRVEQRGIFFADNISKPENGYYYDVLHPVTGKPCKKPKGGWRFIEKTMKQQLADNRIFFGKDETTVPCRKSFLKETEYESPSTVIYLDNRVSTTLIKNLFNDKKAFNNPKFYLLIGRLLKLIGDIDSLYMDAFAGSGTTGQAVINLNREDNGNRKYILCEMAEYFNSVTKPRIEKVIYSEDWKDGKPVSRKGISQCFKYLRLEQYEDTLNNLQPKQTGLEFKDGKAGFEESYLLRYMLDTETKGDLFNLEWFVHPFSMTLKTTKDNELIDTPVDMVETFNYLIGLNVETMRWPKDGYCVVEGTTHIGSERTLVIWRDCEKVSNEALNEFFRKQAYSTTDSEFDKIYVNGDNTLPNIKTDEEHWKVVLIEEEFKKRMFE